MMFGTKRKNKVENKTCIYLGNTGTGLAIDFFPVISIHFYKMWLNPLSKHMLVVKIIQNSRNFFCNSMLCYTCWQSYRPRLAFIQIPEPDLNSDTYPNKVFDISFRFCKKVKKKVKIFNVLTSVILSYFSHDALWLKWSQVHNQRTIVQNIQI